MRFGVGVGIGFLPPRRTGSAGPSINLSASSLTENSAEGTAVGTLSVSGGTGTYTFTLTDSAGSRFKVAGTNGVNLQAGATNSDYETATSYNVTVHADNGAGSVLDRTFSILILDVDESIIPAAPALTWVSLETDDRPDFDVDLPSGNVDSTQDAAAGDDLVLEYQLQSGGSWTEYIRHELTAPDIAGDPITVNGVDAVTNGDYFFRARIERPSPALVGTNSANEAVTINAVSVPVNSVAPVISGNVQVGQTLSTTDGTWSNTPTGYAYQWKRNGSDIGSATASTYVLVELDAGADITCAVTASNGAGSGSPATSNTLAIDVYLVYLTHAESTADNISYTFASVGLGTPAANRKIVVSIASRNSAGTGGLLGSATVAGQALSAQISAAGDSNSNNAIIGVSDVQTGTTGNIFIPWTVSKSRCGIGVWAMYGAGSSTASDTDSTLAAADGNVTLTVPAGGVAVGASYHQAAGSVTWTGLTGRFDAVVEGTIEHCGADLNSHAGGNINMISDWSAADTNGLHVFAAWGR